MQGEAPQKNEHEVHRPASDWDDDGQRATRQNSSDVARWRAEGRFEVPLYIMILPIPTAKGLSSPPRPQEEQQ
jgi:hypothetical protein